MLSRGVGLIISAAIVNVIGMECLTRIWIGIWTVGMVIVGSVEAICGQSQPKYLWLQGVFFSLQNSTAKILCTVSGPAEPKSVGGGAGGGQAGPGARGNEARIEVEISTAGFSGLERKKRGRTDKYDWYSFSFPLVLVMNVMRVLGCVYN